LNVNPIYGIRGYCNGIKRNYIEKVKTKPHLNDTELLELATALKSLEQGPEAKENNALLEEIRPYYLQQIEKNIQLIIKEIIFHYWNT